jgi:hypothetical protein
MREFAEALAPHLAPHLAARMGPHACTQFTDDEAAAVRSTIRWGRVAMGTLIVSAVAWVITAATMVAQAAGVR